MTHKKVLVADRIAKEGTDVLRDKGYDVDVKLDLTEDELAAQIAPYDAIVVRSATPVTRRVIEAAENLKIIGRAGVGVDTIDLDAATERGVIVCNAPTSNIMSAAEHTMALMLACARQLPQANASMHEGKWERSKFLGKELYEDACHLRFGPHRRACGRACACLRHEDHRARPVLQPRARRPAGC